MFSVDPPSVPFFPNPRGRIFQSTVYGEFEAKTAKLVPLVTDANPPGTYSGSCHCGKVRVRLLVPLETVEVKEDNCSICARVSLVAELIPRGHVH